MKMNYKKSTSKSPFKGVLPRKAASAASGDNPARQRKKDYTPTRPKTT